MPHFVTFDHLDTFRFAFVEKAPEVDTDVVLDLELAARGDRQQTADIEVTDDEAVVLISNGEHSGVHDPQTGTCEPLD